MNIDAHFHLWSLARGDYGWMADNPALDPIRRDFGPADYDALRVAGGIDRAVIVQAAPSVAETHYLLGLADATGWIAKVVGWVDFENPADRRELEHLARHPKFAGVRPMIQDIADVDWMHRADVQWGFEAVRDLDLSFDALGLPRHLDNFLRLFERYPDMRVVVDHCMKPAIRENGFDAWAPGIARIAAETPALCKLSGLLTEGAPGCSGPDLKPYVNHVLTAFGPDRVMWGSDWPVLTLNGDLQGWREMARALVPEPDRSAVFGGVAARFYRIQ